MGDEHLDTILATESNKFIKSSVENLITILNDQFEDFSEFNEEFSSTDDDSFSLDNIDYVEASPLDFELVSLEVLFDAECESDSNEFAGELTLLKSIPPGIDETDCDFEEDIRLIEKLLYDNSSPRSPEEFVSANFDAKIKSFSPSPILDCDSERDILIPKDLPSNNSLSFADKESFHFDIPLFSRPPAKPPDGDTGILNIKMIGDIYDQKAFMHKLMITLALHQEKSPDLLSHRCGTVKKFNTYGSHLNKCPMMIHRQNNPPLDVLLFHFYPLDLLKYGGKLVQLSDLKQALRGRQPMLIFLGFFFLVGYASVCSVLVLYMCLETRCLFVCFVVISCPAFPDL
nr:hypothetical protein [Tanacetum cinerariifolium]